MMGKEERKHTVRWGAQSVCMFLLVSLVDHRGSDISFLLTPVFMPTRDCPLSL